MRATIRLWYPRWFLMRLHVPFKVSQGEECFGASFFINTNVWTLLDESELCQVENDQWKGEKLTSLRWNIPCFLSAEALENLALQPGWTQMWLLSMESTEWSYVTDCRLRCMFPTVEMDSMAVVSTGSHMGAAADGTSVRGFWIGRWFAWLGRFSLLLPCFHWT